jgi:CheY-like chemotaxis protein
MAALYQGRPIRLAVPRSRLLVDLAALAGALHEEPEPESAPEPSTQAAPARPVRVLHVEDDLLQQAEMSCLLGTLPDLAFDITPVASEAEAVETFAAPAQTNGKGRFDVVLLDYHLAQGNGLSCLRQLRRLDPLVPIIAISALSDPQIAAELLVAGADDFVSKENLSAGRLGNSLRSAIARAEAVRLRLPPEAELTRALEDVRTGGWSSHLPVGQIQRMVDLICKELGLAPEQQPPVATALLALFLRLFGGANQGVTSPSALPGESPRRS